MSCLCLVVDHEPAIRTHLRVVLQRRGIQCLEAGDAAEALHILKSLDGQIDLLITDVGMPGEMDGIGLACSVQNSFSAQSILLVSDQVDRVPAGFPIVKKPFSPEAILSAVDMALTTRE